MSKVLIVDDEPAILTVLQRVLEADGHEVLSAETGAKAVDLAVTAAPDLVILDLRLPDIDGIELTEVLRRWLQAPILILSGFNDETRKVAALDSGADDYLQKPFGLGELRARLRALQRRTAENQDPVVTYGDLAIDLSAGSVFVSGTETRLTRTEWLLLEALVRNPGKLLTHRRVAAEVWGDGYGEEMRQTLRGHVKALRAKINDDANEPIYIRTESGAGYRWIAEPAGLPPASAAAPEASAPEHLATLHDLNNAITVLTFSLDSALGIARALPHDEAHDELVEKLQRGLATAQRAQDLALALTRPVLEV